MNKDAHFQNYLKKLKIVDLSETWVDDKDLGEIAIKSPKWFKQKLQGAVRTNKEERARGVIITGVKVGLEKVGEIIDGQEGIQKRKVRMYKKIYRIVTVYNGGGMGVAKKDQEKMTEDQEAVNLVIKGDSKAKIDRKVELQRGTQRIQR